METPIYLFHLPVTGGGCKGRTQLKDHFQAQKDKVHLQESQAEPDQQAAEGA